MCWCRVRRAVRAFLHHFRQRVQGQGGDVGAHFRMGERASASNFFACVVIVLAARLEVKLPAVAADGHLHDLGGAFVDAW